MKKYGFSIAQTGIRDKFFLRGRVPKKVMKIRGGAFVFRADLRAIGQDAALYEHSRVCCTKNARPPGNSPKARAGVSLLLCIRRGGFPYRISRTFPLMPDGVVTGGFSIPAIWNRLGKSQASRSSVVATSIRIRFFPG